MEGFDLFIPSGGVRQPRIQYAVDDPSMAILEELRAFGGYRNLNTVYIEALKLGAEILLQRAVEEGRWARQSSRSAVSPPPSAKAVSGLSPVKANGAASKSPRRSRPADAAHEHSPRASAAVPKSQGGRAHLDSAVAVTTAAKAIESSPQPPWEASSLSDADNLERASAVMRMRGSPPSAQEAAQTVAHSGTHPAGDASDFTGESRDARAETAAGPLPYRTNSAADAAFDQFGD